MDKGSRQISIVTLGKGMALVVGYGTLEDRDGTVGGWDDGCYPFGGGWLSSFLHWTEEVDRIEVVGVSALQERSSVAPFTGGRWVEDLLHFPVQLTAKQELLWTRGIRLVN